MRLSRIDLLAGNRARNAAAPEAALRYLSAARELARDSGLADYEHMHQVTLLLAECSFLDGKFQEAFACIDELEAFARSTLDRVPGRNLRSAILTCHEPVRRGVRELGGDRALARSRDPRAQ